MTYGKFQYISIDIPEYLATFLSYNLNTTIEPYSVYKAISINRHSHYGIKLLSLIESADKPSFMLDTKYCLKISNFSGDHYSKPRGHRFFLDLSEANKSKFIDQLKKDFNQCMINYVLGAEFAHKFNGWKPEQKRKGIRVHAITDFCQIHGVSFDDKNLESFVKMIQRAKKSRKTTCITA